MNTARLFLQKLFLAGLLVAAMPLGALAQKASPLFSDGAVLQRDQPIPVWGTAEPGTEVRVKFRSQSVAAKADGEGKWMVELKPEAAGGPDPLTIEGPSASSTVKDVLVGEVWLASGQSNMALPLHSTGTELTPDPGLRVFNLSAKPADAPASTVSGRWEPATAYTSAVAYFFGKELHEQLEVPVGIIISAVGGTAINSWISEEGIGAVPDAKAKLITEEKARVAGYPAAQNAYKEALSAWEAHKKESESRGTAFGERKPNPPLALNTPRRPFCLFNGMIHPLAPYALRGVLWYQGESDAGPKQALEYEEMLRAMIQDWRTLWAQSQFSFLIVQLPAFHLDWAAIRAAQTAVSRDPGNGIVVTLDVGEKTNIHPLNKKPVGERLAHLALADVYGRKISAHSPEPATPEREDGTIRITFVCDEGASLVFKGGDSASGLELAGANGQFFPAQARLEKDNLLVSCPEVPEPEQVRYAWEGYPPVTIFDSYGLPAPPFLLRVKPR